MAKKDEVKVEGATETPTPSQVAESATLKDVKITPELSQFISEQIAQAVRASAQTGNNSGAVSVFGQRDPRSIDTVNVKRIFGKFVIGFKDMQDDELKKAKGIRKYAKYQFDPVRNLREQPYLTLILSDGSRDEEGRLVAEEKEVLLSDYYNNRDYFKANVIEIKEKVYTEDHGVLGAAPYAGAVDDKNKPISRVAIKAETQHVDKVFFVELPGFDKPVEFISDFLA